MYRYLVVDIETKGQHQTKNDMLCFGACIANSLTKEIEVEFQIYLKPKISNDDGWEQRCLDEFWNKPENIETKNNMLQTITEHGVEPSKAMHMFYNWINNRSKEEKDSMIVVTDTSGYDIGFLNHYLSEANLPSMNYIIGNEYRPSRDSSSFHMGIANQLPSQGLWGAEQAALKKLGHSPELLKKNPYKASHVPVEDAKSIAWEVMLLDGLIKK
jgi:DNA polymerase III epsilon subunit-like protein